MQIRNCKEEDIQTIRQFVRSCKPLGVHTGYTYWMLFHYFGESCFMLEENGNTIGYVSGMKSNTFEEVFFVWQIGVAEAFRGKGYGYLLLQKAMESAKRLGCTAMQFTIDPTNQASFNTASRFAQRNNLKMSARGEIKYPHSVSENIEQDTVYEIAI